MCRSGSYGRSTSTGCRRSGSPSRSCRERTCVPCPRSSSASARLPAGTSCMPTSTSGSLVGAGDRRVGDAGNERCSSDACSCLPAAWMKEKATPGDGRYCGEFCVGSAPSASLLHQTGLGWVGGRSLLNCHYLVCGSSCSSSIHVVALPLPHSSPCKVQPRGNDHKTPAPCESQWGCARAGWSGFPSSKIGRRKRCFQTQPPEMDER